MDLFNDLIVAFRQAIAAAWPEVISSGIWEADEALTRSFEHTMNLPYAIIDIGNLPQSDRDGVTNRAWRGPFQIFYIAEVEGDSGTLRTKLMALADYLDANPLAVGQVIPANVDMATSRQLEPNSLLVMLNATQRAGMVSGTVAIGVQR